MFGYKICLYRKILFICFVGGGRFKMVKSNDFEINELIEPLMDSPYMAIVIVDQNGFIDFMNQTFLDLLCMTKEDVIGQYVKSILPNSK
ncbi:MAG TPA: hypothetical protein DD811_05885, partial [Syntrophomonas sp.]|nr:hypothetical protein [Syntrophomonas sp.]